MTWTFLVWINKENELLSLFNAFSSGGSAGGSETLQQILFKMFIMQTCITLSYFFFLTRKCMMSRKTGNVVHIGNHLYFEKPEKAGEKKPNSDRFFFFLNCLPARELTSFDFPTKNPDDCLIFFAIILHILLKTLKESKQK